MLEGKRPPGARVVVFDGEGYFVAAGHRRAAGAARASTSSSSRSTSASRASATRRSRARSSGSTCTTSGIRQRAGLAARGDRRGAACAATTSTASRSSSRPTASSSSPSGSPNEALYLELRRGRGCAARRGDRGGLPDRRLRRAADHRRRDLRRAPARARDRRGEPGDPAAYRSASGSCSNGPDRARDGQDGVSPPRPGDRAHLAPPLRRDSARRPDLAARGRRGRPRPGRSRIPPVPEDRRDGRARREAPALPRRARLRGRARRHAWHRRLRRRAHRRVHPAGAGRRPGDPRVDRRAAVVHREARHVGHLLGRVQRASHRGAPPAGARRDHDALLDGRPLRGRRPLPRRLRPRPRHAALVVVDADLERAAARSAAVRRRAGARSGCAVWRP